MFILVFVVSFGPKKSTLTVYTDIWYTNFYESYKSLLTTLKVNYSAKELTLASLPTKLLYRFQYTVITSRTTIYLLFSFWCFFFFFGESLLLITFNFNTLSDLIPSSFFMIFKAHIIFFLNNGNQFMGDIIFFYILFFTASAFLFLLNLRYMSTYRYLYNLFYLDIIFTLLTLILFLGFSLPLLLSLFILYKSRLLISNSARS
jgi:hypothetical protein